MQQYMNMLGRTVKDKITGSVGIVTSISFDLYGCVQAIVKQQDDKDGRPVEAFWHDVKRLDIIDNKPVMDVPNFAPMRVGTEAGPESKPVPD